MRERNFMKSLLTDSLYEFGYDIESLAEIVSEPIERKYKNAVKSKELKKSVDKNSIDFLLNLKNIL